MEGSKFCSTQWLIDISNIDVFIAEYMGVHVSPTGPTGEIFRYTLQSKTKEKMFSLPKQIPGKENIFRMKILKGLGKNG
mgnify:CR=1 FL=1